ncbi:hypothetical protein [Sodalis ligni]|uniref:Uncharacterized protein n=1 Tax=Sodalis ligni TaxID=2697027 RepID=A0A4R1NIS6_9GAMM|nr:hypothetical protein [Sodalis ligni]TCL05811.1 hypothetical protein EZJ58_4031 [Sodalis ligni]
MPTMTLSSCRRTDALLAIPFSAETDFTLLADYSEQFAETLLEVDEPMQRQALYIRLADCLATLLPTMDAPLPPHLVESLTVDELPSPRLGFEPDADLLCEYCLTLARLLTNRAVTPEMEQTLIGLMFELVSYFAGELKAPRWVRTGKGVKLIAEVENEDQEWVPRWHKTIQF